jgi:hypothetical protein
VGVVDAMDEKRHEGKKKKEREGAEGIREIPYR